MLERISLYAWISVCVCVCVCVSHFPAWVHCVNVYVCLLMTLKNDKLSWQRESTGTCQREMEGGRNKRVQMEMLLGELGGGGGRFAVGAWCDSPCCHQRATKAPEWPSLFPPERPAIGGAALSLFTARSS